MLSVHCCSVHVCVSAENSNFVVALMTDNGPVSITTANRKPHVYADIDIVAERTVAVPFERFHAKRIEIA